MKINQNKYLSPFKYILMTFSLLFSTNITSTNLEAEEAYLQQMQIDTSTKPEENSPGLPTNPFEIVEMIRRANSMNDATKPSDAIDQALEAFDSIEQKD